MKVKKVLCSKALTGFYMDDKEAIKVILGGLGQVGYVANSPYTVCGDSYSAGRLYDKIGDTAKGTVLYVLPQGVLCYVAEGLLEG